MAAALPIPLDDYLGTSYKADREYVDGEVRERNVGKYQHARMQALLAAWFGSREMDWGIVGGIAQRVRVSESRVRVPDLVVLTAGAQPDVLTDPPLLVIEIRSPDDSYSDTQ
jgi:Uma2 family endonuclease